MAIYQCIIAEIVITVSLFLNILPVQCSVSTYSYARRHSEYLIICCDPVNRGKINIAERGSDASLTIFLCPTAPPSNCPISVVTTTVHQSCKSIIDMYPNSTSGYYNITLHNGSDISVYCDMEGVNCDGEGGWTRIAHVNMSEPGASCPDGLYEKELVDSSRTLCTMGSWTESLANVCNSTVFSVHNITHNKVCGYVRGYQHGRGVGHYHDSLSLNKLLGENPLITGVSIVQTNGTALEDICTYMSAWAEEYMNDFFLVSQSCPCQYSQYLNMNYSLPFNNYCESGRPTDNSSSS